MRTGILLFSFCCFAFIASCATTPPGSGTGGPYQTTGVKIGEITHNSVVIWTRGTKRDSPGVPVEEIEKWVNQTNTDFLAGFDLEEALAPKRLGEISDSVGDGGSMVNRAVDEGKRLSKADRDRIIQISAVEGMDGEVAITYRAVDPPGPAVTTRRFDTIDIRDHTRQIKLENLRPNTKYEFDVMMYQDNGDTPTSTLDGSFRTAPAPNQSREVMFTVVTGQAFRNVDLRGEAFAEVNDASRHILEARDADEAAALRNSILGHRIYPVMAILQPDFLVHTGDVVYYDHQGASATSPRMARLWWQRMFSLPVNRGFQRIVPTYFIKDDHDTLKNDCWPGQRHGRLSYAEGRRIFHEQTPLSLDRDLSINDGKTYRTVRWGRDLQIWLPETRDYRSPNDMDPDNPRKTMLGKEQLEWLSRTLRESDATFKMVVCAVPIIGPDRPPEPTDEEKEALGVKNMFRPPRNDNLTNPAWDLERTRLLEEVFAGVDNLILVVGDRHWKYHSAWPSRYHPQIHEFSVGSTSDYHARTGLRMAGVPTPATDDLLFWREEVERGGFLSVRVEPGAAPKAVFRFHDTGGQLVYPVNTAGRREVVIRPGGGTTSARVR